jgi:hypothetical protein
MVRQAGLIVDTVNHSESKSVRSRQVLALGAGWSTEPGDAPIGPIDD